jgi:hypothetical protein
MGIIGDRHCCVYRAVSFQAWHHDHHRHLCYSLLLEEIKKNKREEPIYYVDKAVPLWWLLWEHTIKG